MPKKITECKERWCCLWSDLKPIKEAGRRYDHPKAEWLKMICKHCGNIFEYYRYMDAAGSMDWGYKDQKGYII